MRVATTLTWLWLSSAVVQTTADDSKKTGGPPFFLQDPADSLCLAGDEFKRCSIDTLFYVGGTPGEYRIYKRPTDDDEDAPSKLDDDGMCISKKSCKEADVGKPIDVKLAKCSHCGAKKWNIIGDADTGFVLTEDGGQNCVVRPKGTNKAVVQPCDLSDGDIPYTLFHLSFASAADIKTMSSSGARLIGAASDGDKKAIQALLKEGVDVNVRDWDDLTALIPAASSGHLEICKFLVKEGIDVNAKDKDGITALMEASIMGHTKVVDFLLSSGAEVDAAASSDVTALWLAASEGQVDCMKSLLKKGADPSNTRTDGITALMTACVGGHLEAAKLLLEKGADATAIDGDGLTAVMNAAENGTVSVLQLLVEHINDPEHLNLFSKTGFNALIIASAHGRTESVEFLLEAGVDANNSGDNDVTPLMYAASAGHVDTMAALIDKGGADVNAPHENGGTALMEASTAGFPESIKLLIEKGASIDFTDNDGVTPLMASASQGSLEGLTEILEGLKKIKSQEELVEHINLLSMSGGSAVMFSAAAGHVESTKLLIEHGADVKKIAQAAEGYPERLKQMIAEGKYQDEEPHVDAVTALHVAAQGGFLDCVEVLLEAGADITVLDAEGRSSLQLAVKNNHGDVAMALVKAGADPNTLYVDAEGDAHNLLFDAIMVENEEFAKLLIEKGADISHTDESKVTTLLQASHRGSTEVVKMLLEKNSSLEFVDAASEDGITPLIAAASEGHGDIVKLLVEAKANIDAKDNDGTTALMAASARGHLQVVVDLLAAGASVNEQNSDGHTALMFAYNGKNQVETLWERYSQYVAESKAEDPDDDPEDGGTGPIIREALANHTALVDLLLKSGADATLKDKEGHTAADFDFHPDADAEVLSKEAKAEKSRDESKNEL